MRAYTGSRDDASTRLAISPIDWRDFTSVDGVVEASAVWSVGESVHLIGPEEPLRLNAPRASAGLFPILGAEPVHGRFFTAGEEVPGQDDAVVLSHGLWRRAFGGDPAIVGSTVLLDDRSYRVVGVAPRTGVEPRDADLWRALALEPVWFSDERWGWQFLEGYVRLTPGTDRVTAESVLNARLESVVPDRAIRLGQTRVLRSLQDERAAGTGRAVLALLAAVGLVLAMACANIMNLLRARSDARLRELALRRALGSGAAALGRLLLVETALLAAAGAIGGLIVAELSLRWVAASELAALTDLGPLDMDGRVLLFGVLVTAATALLFGAAPVADAVRADPHAVLTDTGARGGGSRAGARLRDGLVVVQVMLAITLLVGVGAAAGTFRSLVEADPGFEPGGVLTATIELPRSLDAGDARAAAYRAMFERIGALPGVRSVAAANFLPLEGVGWSSSIELVDPDPGVTDPDPGGNMRPVSPGYFATMGIPLLEGRDFAATDEPGSTPVAIVDEVLARRYWPGGSPVGRNVVLGGLSRDMATIIGVVGSVPDISLDREGAGHAYFPVLQSPQRRMTLVARTDGAPAALAAGLRGAIRDVDPRIPVTDVSTLEQRVGESLSGMRTGVTLLIAFGIAAVLLAALGIYGVLAYSVTRRTSEIGIRVALGAAPRAVFRGVVAHAMRLWAVGSALGIVVALLAAGIVPRILAGVAGPGFATYAGACAVLGLVAFIGASLPAGRATGVDPADALRAE